MINKERERERINEVIESLKEIPLEDDDRIFFEKIELAKEDKDQRIKKVNESFTEFHNNLQAMVMDDKDLAFHFLWRENANGLMEYLEEKLEDYINLTYEEKEELSLRS